MITQDEISDLLGLRNELAASRVDVVPSGWVTREYLQELWGQSKTKAIQLVREAIKGRRMQRRNYRVMDHGKIMAKPHYKVVKP